MKILSIILGALLAICGISCMFTPIMSFFGAGYWLVILLMAYGIMGVVRGVSAKAYGLDFIFGILSVIFGLVILFVPGMLLRTEGLLIYWIAAWFVVRGIVSIYISIKTKGAGNKWWVCGLILGVLSALLGVYSFMHPLLLAFTMGILIGIYFIETGIDMVVLAVEGN